MKGRSNRPSTILWTLNRMKLRYQLYLVSFNFRIHCWQDEFLRSCILCVSHLCVYWRNNSLPVMLSSRKEEFNYSIRRRGRGKRNCLMIYELGSEHWEDLWKDWLEGSTLFVAFVFMSTTKLLFVTERPISLNWIKVKFGIFEIFFWRPSVQQRWTTAWICCIAAHGWSTMHKNLICHWY